MENAGREKAGAVPHSIIRHHRNPQNAFPVALKTKLVAHTTRRIDRLVASRMLEALSVATELEGVPNDLVL